MIVNIDVQLDYGMVLPTNLILQIEAPESEHQRIVREEINFGQTGAISRVVGEGGFGKRVLIEMTEDFSCRYSAQIELDRPDIELASLAATKPNTLPAEAVRAIMPSRYCLSDQMLNVAKTKFGKHEGGAKIAAMRDWVFDEFDYVPGASNSQTTAIDSYVSRQGVCRDYAHVLITLARAAGIPARFVSGYAPHVAPQDIHAVAEVFLDGAWHLVDATKMSTPSEFVRIGTGLDAAEVAFLSSYDLINFKWHSVQVSVG